MANNLQNNPILIDTTMTQGFKASVGTAFGKFTTLLIEKVYWLNPANIGDTVTLVDPLTGLEILTLRCEVVGQSQIVDWSASPKLVRDFRVNTIISGSLKIYLR